VYPSWFEENPTPYTVECLADATIKIVANCRTTVLRLRTTAHFKHYGLM